MRPQPHDVDRGFGAGLAPDPAFTAPDDTGWTHFRVARKAATDYNVRCQNVVRIHGSDGLTKTCNCLLAARVTRPYTLQCRKCKHELKVEADE